MFLFLQFFEYKLIKVIFLIFNFSFKKIFKFDLDNYKNCKKLYLIWYICVSIIIFFDYKMYVNNGNLSK